MNAREWERRSGFASVLTERVHFLMMNGCGSSESKSRANWIGVTSVLRIGFYYGFLESFRVDKRQECGIPNWGIPLHLPLGLGKYFARFFKDYASKITKKRQLEESEMTVSDREKWGSGGIMQRIPWALCVEWPLGA